MKTAVRDLIVSGRRRLWPSLLLLVLFIYLVLFSAFADAASVSSTQKQIKQLQGEIRELESQLSEMQGQRTELQQALRDGELKIGKLHKRIDAIREEMQAGQRQLQNFTGERNRLLQRKQEKQAVLEQQLLSAYRVGREDHVKLLLNQEEPERVSRMMRYYGYITAVQVATLEDYEQTLTEIQQVEAEINRQQTALKDSEAVLLQQSADLKEAKADRAKTLAKLQHEIGQGEAELVQLKANQARLQAVVERLQQSLERADLAWQNKDFQQLKGGLKWPIKGHLIRRYGSLDRLGLRSEGVVISAPAGGPVRAVHNGRVVFSNWLRGFGLLVIVDHGSGYMSLYGHNQTLLKDVGDWVTAEEQIATVGDSGGLSESGLYFAIRHKGRPTNPQSWLARK